MRTLSGAAALLLSLGLSACATDDTGPEHPALFRYQHVANVHQIRFASPLALPGGRGPVGFVTARDARGFWAVFVLCDADTRDTIPPGFRFDVSKLRIAYGSKLFGPLPPYTLRYQGSTELNLPKDSVVMEKAIGDEVSTGPPIAVFARGYFPDLNYRFALFVPRALPDYAGEPLALRYLGQPAILQRNRYPPSDIRAAGGSGAGIAASCLP